MKIKIIAAMVFISLGINAVMAEELPFGAKDLLIPDGSTFTQEMQILKDSLGFNHFWARWSTSDIEIAGNYGIKTIYQGGSGDPIYRNTFYHWAQIQAEDTLNTIKMYNCGGSYQEEAGYWVSTGFDMLYGPNGFRPTCWT